MALAWFALALLFQVLPVNQADIANLPIDAPRILVLFLAVLLVGWLAMLLLGSRTRFGQHVFTTSAITAMGGFVMACLTYSCLFIFEKGFGTTAVTNVVTSLIPYYYLVLVAYSSEISANLRKQWERVLLAIIVICAMYGAYFYL
jgi:hypothetical protein